MTFSTMRNRKKLKPLKQSCAQLSSGHILWWGDTRSCLLIPKPKADSITALWVWRTQVGDALGDFPFSWAQNHSSSGKLQGKRRGKRQHVMIASFFKQATPKRPWHLHPCSFLNFNSLCYWSSLWLTQFIYPKRHYIFDTYFSSVLDSVAIRLLVL